MIHSIQNETKILELAAMTMYSEFESIRSGH